MLLGKVGLKNRLSIFIWLRIVAELTQHTPMAEEITGPGTVASRRTACRDGADLFTVSASALTRWIPRLPRLRSLDLWDGKALEDERLASLITVHCPNFEDLSIYTWVGNDTDHKLSAFISDLPGDHLHGFKTLSGTGIAAESFLALNNHGQSLRVLKLFLDHDAVPHLGLLKGCVRLETLDISDSSGAVDLEATQNDVFLEMVNWLRDCRDLRQLSFSKFRSAAALSARVLSNSDIKLEQLKLDSYMVKDQTAFHVALTQQPNLTSLSLEGNSDDIFGDDRTVFVNSICHLEQLRYLRLIFRSDDVDLLTDPEIGKLADHLTNLEEFHTSGYGVTDAVLERVSGLGKLRSLSFPAVTAFTLNGLLDFISKLGPGNQELTFLIEMADPDSALTEQEQEIVREALLAKVGGSFGYLLLRGGLDDRISQTQTDSSQNLTLKTTRTTRTNEQSSVER